MQKQCFVSPSGRGRWQRRPGRWGLVLKDRLASERAGLRRTRFHDASESADVLVLLLVLVVMP